jgi:AraC-like DNA-binding protein
MEQAGNALTQVIAHESSLGSWTLQMLDFHSALRGIVTHIWFADGKVAYGRDRILPRASSFLLINLGPPQYMIVAGKREARVPFGDIWFSGIGDMPIDTEAPFGSRIVGVAFTEIGAAAFLRIPQHLVANRTGSFEDLVGADARRLHQRLLNTPDSVDCLRLTESFLLGRIASGFNVHPLVNWAARLIATSSGRLRTGHLVRESGISRKHLSRLFREHVGLLPTTLARIHRFQNALQSVATRGPVDWSEVALDAGYYDQPHMVNEFRELSGLTPLQLARCARPDANSVVLW